MEHYEESRHINVGTGADISIRSLAELIASIVHPRARLVFDSSKPDGTPRKQLDVGRINALGWRHEIELVDGITETYGWFLDNNVDQENRTKVGVRGRSGQTGL